MKEHPPLTIWPSGTVRGSVYWPMQSCPLPCWYPGRHWHVKLPSVLKQTANWPQLSSPTEHSLISSHSQTDPHIILHWWVEIYLYLHKLFHLLCSHLCIDTRTILARWCTQRSHHSHPSQWYTHQHLYNKLYVCERSFFSTLLFAIEYRSHLNTKCVCTRPHIPKQILPFPWYPSRQEQS